MMEWPASNREVGAVAGDHALLLAHAALDARLDETIQIWTMTPRCFLFAIGGIGPRRTGGEIFSNVKAGIVYPLVVELKHSWSFPRYPR